MQAKVLVDSYSWHDTHGDTSSPVHTAGKGDTISVSPDEFKRGQNMVPSALAKSKDAKTVDENPDIPRDLSESSDEELRDLARQFGHDVDDDTSRDELVGMVAAAPGYSRPQV